MKRLLIAGFLVAGCANVSVATPSTDGPEPPAITVPEATPVPVTSNIYRAGETIVVAENGEDSLEITVDQVKQRTKYAGEYFDDTPEPGNVYIEAFVTYHALGSNASYASYDWEIYVADVAIDTFTLVLNGPEPELGIGQLPQGRRAEGWLVYEIPAEGRVVLSYSANIFAGNAPVFEVVLRNE